MNSANLHINALVKVATFDSIYNAFAKVILHSLLCKPVVHLSCFNSASCRFAWFCPPAHIVAFHFATMADKSLAPGKPIGSLNYVLQNCLSTNLHSPAKDNLKKPSKRGMRKQKSLVNKCVSKSASK